MAEIITSSGPTATLHDDGLGKSPPDARRFWRVLLAVVAPLPALALAVAALVTPYQVEADAAAALADGDPMALAAVRNDLDRTVMVALGWALTVVGYSSASLALLRMSNDAFDLPPSTVASTR